MFATDQRSDMNVKIEQENREERIKTRAYLIWLQFGCDDARKNWLAAERQIEKEERDRENTDVTNWYYT